MARDRMLGTSSLMTCRVQVSLERMGAPAARHPARGSAQQAGAQRADVGHRLPARCRVPALAAQAGGNTDRSAQGAEHESTAAVCSWIAGRPCHHENECGVIGAGPWSATPAVGLAEYGFAHKSSGAGFACELRRAANCAWNCRRALEHADEAMLEHG